MLLTATITPLEKKPLIMFYDVQGNEQGNLLSFDEDRSMENTGILDESFLGVLGLFHSQCKLTADLNTSWLAISVCHVAVWQITEKKNKINQ